RRAPCSSGRVSQAMTDTAGSRAARAAITASAVPPSPPHASAPVLQCVSTRDAPASSDAPCAPIATFAASCSAMIASASADAAAAATALIALALAAPAHAADPIMPLQQVKKGMRCTARTVIQGTDIATFDVEVLDVVAGDPADNDPLILVRVSGPAVDQTGIA